METLTPVPPSREVRLKDGWTEGWIEDVLFRAHTGSTSELTGLISEAELMRQHERAKAAEALVYLLRQKIHIGGFPSLVEVDIADALHEFKNNEVLDIHPELESPRGD